MPSWQIDSLVDPTAHFVYEAMIDLGWEIQNASEITDRVQRLALGLPAEDELCVILDWLGNCRLIHKLDQMQAPQASKDQYRVPDLLAIFSLHGRDVPVLVEVKVSNERRLSWRPDYFEALRRYGQVLGLPVLVAWKATSTGVWFLIDIDRFQKPNKNYRLTLEAAAKANLLGALAGDFIVQLQPGLGMKLTLHNVHSLTTDIQTDESSTAVLLEIADAEFIAPSGEPIRKLGAGIWTLFWATGPTEEQEEIDQGYKIKLSIPPHGASAWAHAAITTILALDEGAAGAPSPFHWHRILQKRNYPITSSALNEAAVDGIKDGTVRYLFRQIPDVSPRFLAHE